MSANADIPPIGLPTARDIDRRLTEIREKVAHIESSINEINTLMAERQVIDSQLEAAIARCEAITKGI